MIAMKYQFEVIIHDSLRNKFMIMADLFEKGKVLGEWALVEMEAGIEDPQRALDIIVQGLTTNPHIICSFIYLDDKHIWWNKEVRIISDGSKWGVLEDILRKKYPKLLITTDQYRYITDIKKNPNIY